MVPSKDVVSHYYHCVLAQRAGFLVEARTGTSNHGPIAPLHLRSVMKVIYTGHLIWLSLSSLV